MSAVCSVEEPFSACLIKSQRTTALGHEDAFPRPRLNARCRFSQGTFAGARGNGREAPKAVVETGRLNPLPLTRIFVTSRSRVASSQTVRDVCDTVADRSRCVCCGDVR